jgi:hypothetical protein
MTSRVFVVQHPSTFDRTTRTIIPKYDLSPAGKFGEVVVMLPPESIFAPRFLMKAVKTLREKLADYTPEDFIVAVGDPAAIAAAVMIASAKTNGAVTLLKWDRIEREYRPYQINVGV